MFEIYDRIILPLNSNKHFYFYAIDCWSSDIAIYPINSLSGGGEESVRSQITQMIQYCYNLI